MPSRSIYALQNNLRDKSEHLLNHKQCVVVFWVLKRFWSQPQVWSSDKINLARLLCLNFLQQHFAHASFQCFYVHSCRGHTDHRSQETETVGTQGWSQRHEEQQADRGKSKRSLKGKKGNALDRGHKTDFSQVYIILSIAIASLAFWNEKDGAWWVRCYLFVTG